MAQHSNFGNLPGFGRPLDWNDNAELSPTTPNSFLMRLITLCEMTMLAFMNQLTDKPGWDKKVFDSTITEKWKEEVLSQAQPASSNALVPPDASEVMTEKLVDWCIAELQFKAKAFQENGGLVSIYNSDVVKLDTAIPSEVQVSLHTAVVPLEDIPDRLKDWHPGSDDLDLDLDHPSLFPLVYGCTRVLKDGVTTLDDCIE
ncbi:uncharacterized protein LACBIDRAFT_325714 [Laccaria bicolor S238N-H82]|uniref:Predicted protein n=1 Tax=Laccaria bicolor (strain S238N-H82 / ATCC MYA-4686) TaxID=486041 RepID=B0D5Z0_LACBS|nr:uncharacterized protein LACBIDRAFT_325714 [Laccaria bicolor S238N-H82]EDR10107.1 predicted protein [Laccaria bicolor S238N-H82]|eukprot:XP_001879492.1 predicted protein [Laccaria bicolor S238N-H82]